MYLEEVLEIFWETVRILEARNKEEERLEKPEEERLAKLEKIIKKKRIGK
jgi:hypothetical protein